MEEVAENAGRVWRWRMFMRLVASTELTMEHWSTDQGDGDQ